MTTRYKDAPDFADKTKVYCMRMAPAEQWSRKGSGEPVPLFCSLSHDHDGDHKFSERWEELKKEGGEPEAKD